jgi:hypothetical protein
MNKGLFCGMVIISCAVIGANPALGLGCLGLTFHIAWNRAV